MALGIGGNPFLTSGIGGVGGGFGGIGGAGGGGFSPDVTGTIAVNSATGQQSLAVAASQQKLSQDMSLANNINTTASVQRDMTFGSNSQLRQSAQRLFQ